MPWLSIPRRLFVLAFVATTAFAQAPPGPMRTNSDELPGVTLITAVQQPDKGQAALVFVVRNDSFRDRSVSLFGSPKLAFSSPDGTCKTRDLKQSLVIEPSRENPVGICVYPAGALKARLIARGVDGAGAPVLAVSDLLEFPKEAESHWWENTLLSTLLSAAVGFVLGLGSTVFGVWYETRKLTQINRAEGERFLIARLFPELAIHAAQIKKFVEYSDPDRRDHAAEPLLQTNLHNALYGESKDKLYSYLKSLSRRQLANKITRYDALVTDFNSQAAANLREPTAQRNTTRMLEIAGNLQIQLSEFGIA